MTAEQAPPPVVAGPPGSYVSITISATGGTPVPIPPDQRTRVAPLLAARTFTQPGDLSVYGLDRPTARLTYTDAAGASTVVALGGTTFDAHGVYAQQQGSSVVSVVLADNLRSVLSLVAVSLPPPT
jgi:hypothetical protein